MLAIFFAVPEDKLLVHLCLFQKMVQTVTELRPTSLPAAFNERNPDPLVIVGKLLEVRPCLSVLLQPPEDVGCDFHLLVFEESLGVLEGGEARRSHFAEFH